MPFNSPRPPRLAQVVGVGALGLAVGIGATLAVSGLRGGGDPVASVQRLELPATPATTAPPGKGVDAARPVVAGTARAAVQRFLKATARGDFSAAYRLLDAAGRKRYPSAARWTRAQADRTAIAGVRVGAAKPAGRPEGSGEPRRGAPVNREGSGEPRRGAPVGQVMDVTVRLTHPAAIDPFAGLVPARTVEVWRARSEGGGWRVAADPVSVRAELPSDQRAPDAVTAWVQRLIGCDRQGATQLQVGADLYGPADLAEAPCKQRGRWTVGGPRTFDEAAEPEAYVAAFGPDVGSWARLVPVQGPGTRFHVVVGPLGDAWRVLGTDPVQPAK